METATQNQSHRSKMLPRSPSIMNTMSNIEHRICHMETASMTVLNVLGLCKHLEMQLMTTDIERNKRYLLFWESKEIHFI